MTMSTTISDYKARVYREISEARFKYKIEKNIPLQIQQAYKGGRTAGVQQRLYPLALMSVGDSFFVPASDFDNPTRIGWVSISQAINSIRQREGEKRFCYRSRTLAEHKEEGWRVWRVR